MNVIMPNAFLPPQAWLPLFCQEPLVYHAFVSVFNLQLAVSNAEALTLARQRMLFHRGEAIRLLNDRLRHLRTEDIGAVLVGMLTVHPDETEVNKASTYEPNLFVSHMPWNNNSPIYAGSDPENLCRAISHLVERAGGIKNLKVPSLPKAISKYSYSVYSDVFTPYADALESRADLQLASSSYSQPLFSWLWPVEPSMLHRDSLWYEAADNQSRTGSGFDELSDHFSQGARQCFQDLAFVDRTMAQSRTHRLQGIDLEMLITARDTAHHYLLSLPPWDKCSETRGHDPGRVIYECCRLTSIIYVHCVMSPLLPGCPGILKPLTELRELLDSVDTLVTKGYEAGMLLWSVFVSGIAAFRTQHKDFFSELLRRLVLAHHISSLQDALSVCRSFIWADCACIQGASVLWELAC